MKRLEFMLMMVMFTFFAADLTYADCMTVRYYSVNGYVSHNDLIDTDNSEGSFGFFNSDNIFVKINALGTYDHPRSISNQVLTDRNLTSTVDEFIASDPVYFYVSFDETIEIGELELDIDAVNSADGAAVGRRIYVNAFKSRDTEGSPKLTTHYGTLVAESHVNETMKVKLNNMEVDTILVEFDYDADNEYTLNYFQIGEYSVMEHVGWTTDYLPDTLIKDTVICEGTGEYIPDGSDGRWYQEYATTFSPSVDIVSDYIPKRSSYYAIAYDAQDEGSLRYEATPADISYYFTDYDKIGEWTSEGNLPYKIFASNGLDSEYIMTSGNEGYRYQVRPYYWDGIGENYVHSMTSGYCKYFTHQNIGTCYKHFGHVSNQLINYFDVYIEKFTDITPIEYQKIDNVKYYLCDEDLACELIDEKGDGIFRMNLNRSGIYRVNAVITDLYGNTNNKYSEQFFIDNEEPVVEFSHEETEGLRITADVHDDLSGISRYYYQVSTDGGITYSERSDWFYDGELELDYYAGGKYKIRIVASDNAGNVRTCYSDTYDLIRSDYSITDAYGFVYSEDTDAQLHFRVKCDGCVTEENVEVRVLQDSELIYSDTISLLDYKDLTVNYRGGDISTDFTIETLSDDTDHDDNRLLITTYEKYPETVETDQMLTEFRGVVCTVAAVPGQTEIFENLNLQVIQDRQYYMAGEGMDIRLRAEYHNGCSMVEDYKCIASDEISGNIEAVFDDGVSSLKPFFFNDGKYRVILDRNEEYYLIDRMYVDFRTGDVTLTEMAGSIDGGNRWYTEFNSELKDYAYLLEGSSLGINGMHYIYHGSYALDGNYLDQIKVRFVDISQPFPNRKSELWNDDLFFTGLSDAVVIRMVEIK